MGSGRQKCNHPKEASYVGFGRDFFFQSSYGRASKNMSFVSGEAQNFKWRFVLDPTSERVKKVNLDLNHST